MAKVERKKVVPVFEPVVITLESQAEVDFIMSLLGKASDIIARESGMADIGNLYNDLIEYESPTRPRLRGRLEV